ncbi:MAG: RsmD family RNA methyltransferase [Bacteroidia bacterium]|nr:RsmD family RNA methyltransferase [Bacteroidia bacterium]MDW8159491.1 RsmD family RNA methyltransferase [Bacteroidia bacterium]
MRIISGFLKGRKIEPPPGLGIRPTTDRAREALFNILGLGYRVQWQQISVLDLFCGSGAVSLEFISRGAKAVYSVEKNKRTIQFLETVKKNWNLSNWHIYCEDAEEFIEFFNTSLSLVFLDPPYQRVNKEKLIFRILNSNWLMPGGLVIVEHPTYEIFDTHPYFVEKRAYGYSTFSFFEKK